MYSITVNTCNMYYISAANTVVNTCNMYYISANTVVNTCNMYSITVNTCIRSTSLAHRIKNPLRRTSEHITLHDLKH